MPRNPHQPPFHAGMLVRRIVVNDHVHFQLRWNTLINVSQEIQIFLMAMPPTALAEYAACSRVQRCEKRGRTVATVVMRYALHVA